MPHIDIKCYPKELTDQERDAFVRDLTALVERHLKATADDLSVVYTEVLPQEWTALYDDEIRPRLGTLLKEPGYSM